MTKNVRQLLIVSFTFFGGIYFFLEFILPKTVAGIEIGKYNLEITDGVILIGTMAVGLGIINLLRVHGLNILKTRKGWFNSVALLAGLFIVFGIEIVDFINTEKRSDELQQISILNTYLSNIQSSSLSSAERIKKLELMSERFDVILEQTKSSNSYLSTHNLNEVTKPAADQFKKSLVRAKDITTHLIHNYTNGEETTVAAEGVRTAIKNISAAATEIAEFNYQQTNMRVTSRFVFEAFFVPLGSAMFSLLAFYVATASYRTFRVHSLEAMIMMVAAIIVMLGQIPQGPMYISEHLPSIRNWLMEYLSNPAFRAIFFGSMIAALAMAVRMWFSLEKSPLAVDDSSN